MRRTQLAAVVLGLVAGVGGLGLGAAPAERWIGAPAMAPTAVTAAGEVRSPWGTLTAVVQPEAGGTAAPASSAAPASLAAAWGAGPAPTAVTVATSGAWALTTAAYRAPVWPAGLDVLTVTVRNTGPELARASLALRGPDGLALNGSVLALGGRGVVALPVAPPVPRPWGFVGDAEALLGWCHPSVPCDPAYRNVRAGMGGVPIMYRFSCPRGSAWKVAAGLCESHWAEPGQRPVTVTAEGAKPQTVDCVKQWGQHVPGVLFFDAKDANGDGLVEVTSKPAPGAPDRNPILNVLWVFPADATVSTPDLIAGKLSATATHYVDVGGPADHTWSEPGVWTGQRGGATCALVLDGGAQTELTFLLALHTPVPAWEKAGWSPRSLRKAADDVWAGWFQEGSPLTPADAAAAADYRAALATLAMSQTQANGFHACLPQPGPVESFTFAASGRMLEALEAAGFRREAARLLRLYWDKPVPGPLAALGQPTDGQWQDATKSVAAHAHALLALARGATPCLDPDLVARAYPAVTAGAAWLRKTHAADKLPATDAPVAAAALAAAADLAQALGQADDAAWMTAEAKALGDARPDAAQAYAGLGPAVDAANLVLQAHAAAR